MYDVIIIGLGAMGSAATYELAGAGASVLALEQFPALHDRGSSHGKTRMIRKAYFEGDFYIPLLERAYEKWHELDALSDQSLITLCGGLYSGPPDGAVIANTLASAAKYNLEVETLDGEQVKKRFPAFRLGKGRVGVFEPAAGYTNADETLGLYHRLAAANGADLHFEEEVRDILTAGGEVQVRTGKGDYQSKKLIITAGAWLQGIAANLGAPLPLEVWRMVLHWFEPEGPREDFTPPGFIPNLWHMDDGAIFYGFPWANDDIGVKYAFHNRQNPVVDPHNPDREIRREEIREAEAALRLHVPGLEGRHLESKTCLYTQTPDGHFVIGALPGFDNIIFAGGFSGHGFKFTPVVGEVLKDLALEGQTGYDISAFAVERFD